MPKQMVRVAYSSFTCCVPACKLVVPMRPRRYYYQFRSWIAFILCMATMATLASPRALAGAEDKLSPHYREWLDRDVAYIITRAEKNSFLQLTTDEAREQFIEQFWEIRNPTPGAPTNPYRDEH